MKFLYSLITCSLCLLYSCNLKSGHPQADMAQDPAATAMNEKIINGYTDSLDKNIGSVQKKVSLVYTKEDHSFYVEQYDRDGKTILLSVYEENGALKKVQKKYYFKSDSLILVKSSSIQNAGGNPVLKDSLSYLRNHTIFKMTSRSATDQTQLKATPYRMLTADQKKNAEAYLQQTDLLKDAVQQQNQFDMVYESVNGAPDENYLILKSKTSPAYEASVLIEEKDAFIDSLKTDPLKYKGEKIRFNWIIKDKQALYVPVASKVTSARGLNK